MNYKKSLIISAITLGIGVTGFAQSAKFDLNGLGRSILTNDVLSGNLVSGSPTTQKSAASGYNLFDLQTNLAVDSNFKAMAVFRARSPFGSFFGAATAFEFRQFNMMGNLKKFKYEIGDIRVEMTPYTVFNSYITDLPFESDLFKMRREIQEYENFNKGNSWLLQGAAGQYFYKMNEEGMGLGIYAFTTRNTSTNETTTPDRLLSGGRLEFKVNKGLGIAVNAVKLYDISVISSEYDYDNNVFTGDVKFNMENDAYRLSAVLEGGMSAYKYSYFDDQDTIVEQTDTSYQDGFVDLKLALVLKQSKLRFDLEGRRVGVLFSSPSAQSRRIDDLGNPLLFSAVPGGARAQILFDRSTSEGIYNAKITPTLMAFMPFYNNSTPYGDATPNRQGGSLRFGTDTSNHIIDGGVKFSYLKELQGEGGEETRGFMLIAGGLNAHLGKVLDITRNFDLNAGIRYENTNRAGLAPIALTSMLVDAGIAFELVKKIDLLAGMKYLVAEGNEYVAVRDGFNLVTDFTTMDVNINEAIYSFGARIRFSTSQYFSVNYNIVKFADKNTAALGYNMNQLFINYTGRF